MQSTFDMQYCTFWNQIPVYTRNCKWNAVYNVILNLHFEYWLHLIYRSTKNAKVRKSMFTKKMFVSVQLCVCTVIIDNLGKILRVVFYAHAHVIQNMSRTWTVLRKRGPQPCWLHKIVFDFVQPRADSLSSRLCRTSKFDWIDVVCALQLMQESKGGVITSEFINVFGFGIENLRL